VSAIATVTLIACYGTLLVELTLLHVPSVASSRNLWKLDEAAAAGLFGRPVDALQQRPPVKLLLLAVPIAIIYFVFLFPLYVAFFGGSSAHLYVYPPAVAPLFVALPLMVTGRAITLTATITMRRPGADTHHLLNDGIFRLSRNPGLVGMYAFFAGTWLLVPSAWLLPGLLVYVLHMHSRVRLEEQFLQRRFGEDYRSYRYSVPRYLL
jgi:protein-S-isoprenylcysteine O-methyltransferase Ste14